LGREPGIIEEESFTSPKAQAQKHVWIQKKV